MKARSKISVIDLFAGPGGLGEGFSSFTDKRGIHPFEIRLSAENDPFAQLTLELRTFLRTFRDKGGAPHEYSDFIRGRISRNELFERYQRQAAHARDHAQAFELGEHNRKILEARLNEAGLDSDHTVVIGGPPCQAYSLAGRSRNSAKSGWSLERDSRSHLYREYLHVIAHVQPAAFIMENVKGLLSVQLDGKSLFDQIVQDLSDPVKALGKRGAGRRYRVVPIVQYAETGSSKSSAENSIFSPSSFVVRAEQHGIPQARHRVILLGVCESHSFRSHARLEHAEPVSVRAAIGNLPRLRSGLSRVGDSWTDWFNAISAVQRSSWWNEIEKGVADRIRQALDDTSDLTLEREVSVVSSRPRGKVVVNHQARGHRQDDLHRYLYASAWAEYYGVSPTLRDYPKALLPEHANISRALARGHFGDRFRVQVWDHPSTTVVSHISKDGHYYIHPDPAQCRSLTVREAARLQTFPDDYWFCGPRTAQYHQVGNAVPVSLARQIAGLVYFIIK